MQKNFLTTRYIMHVIGIFHSFTSPLEGEVCFQLEVEPKVRKQGEGLSIIFLLRTFLYRQESTKEAPTRTTFASQK